MWNSINKEKGCRKIVFALVYIKIYIYIYDDEYPYHLVQSKDGEIKKPYIFNFMK